MVKNSEQPKTTFLGKRVSFDSNSIPEDYLAATPFSSELEKKSSRFEAGFLQSDNIERLFQVAQTLHDTNSVNSSAGNIRNDDHLLYRSGHNIRIAKNSKSFNTAKNTSYETAAEDMTSLRHRVEIEKLSTVFPRDNKYFSADVTLHKETDADKGAGQILQSRVVGFKEDPESIADKVTSTTDLNDSSSRTDTGKGCRPCSRRGSGDSLDPYRGYSSQKRHGRKASLGTMDLTRLIPTLVSENEEFRHKEYELKLRAQSKELSSRVG